MDCPPEQKTEALVDRWPTVWNSSYNGKTRSKRRDQGQSDFLKANDKRVYHTK